MTLYNHLMFPLTPWQNFYILLGSAAGALTGLQFVVMALIADMPMEADDAGTADAFATPTIVHFVAVLAISAALVIPWHGLVGPGVVCAVGGLAGVVYTAIVARRMVRQSGYAPVAEDWAFHAVLPGVAYLAAPVFAVVMRCEARAALFGIAAAALALLAVGIHNAWDNVTFLVFLRRERLNRR